MLRLTYKDTEGYDKTVDVNDGPFVIGRHSSCDLCIADERLSRQHLTIESFGGVYYADDPGSSNGTRLNGSDLYERSELRDGDTLDLGGGMTCSVRIVQEKIEASANSSELSMMKTGTFKRSDIQPAVARPEPTITSASGEAKGGIPTFVYLLAPVAAIFLLVFAGGAVYLASSGNSESNNRVTVENEDPLEFDDEPKTPKSKSTSQEGPVTGNTTDTPGPVSGNSVTSQQTEVKQSPQSGETGAILKVEQNAASFLRNIATNDPKAFLTGEQAARVNAKIDQLKNSGTLAANIASAKKNSGQLAALARSTNLKPQFVAVAAIAGLGSGRGDVLQAAQAQSQVFEKLLPQIGTEFADDALLMIAAFEQGKAGQHLKMRNMLQSLAEEYSDSSRSIRSIWFLIKHGKITNAEFERALTFLAIGTIVQNPKDFGVNAEALTI